MTYFNKQPEKPLPYLAIPLFLMEAPHKEMSCEAKLLYGLLLRRVNLSRKSGWLDDCGRVFQHYTIAEVCKSLCCCKQKALDTLRELEQADLLERRNQGLGKPAKLLLKQPTLSCQTGTERSIYEDILDRDIVS